MKNLIDLLKESSAEYIQSLESMSSQLLFLKFGTNLVFGETKSGKTYTVIKSLIDAGFKDQIVHVDFDNNRDKTLRNLGIETYHIRDKITLFNNFITANNENSFDHSNSLKEKILVIDSLQDLSTKNGIDTNAGALEAFQLIDIFSSTGATIILIHHATADMNGKLKVKGNSSVIMSKCDTTILFQKISNDKRVMTVLNTRSEDQIPSGSKKEYYTNTNVEEKSISVKRNNSRVPK